MILPMARHHIPLPVIATVSDVIGTHYYSHTKLNTLFQESGAPGEVPDGNCVNKVRNWLQRFNEDDSVGDPLNLLANVIGDFMAKDLPFVDSWVKGHARILAALERCGLVFSWTGGVATIRPTGGHEAPLALPVAVRPVDSHLLPNPAENPISNRVVAQSTALLAHSRDIFVVYGRNHRAYEALCTFLGAIDLRPLEWEEMVARTGHASPYIGDVLKTGFRTTAATVVLLTGDDAALLRRQFHRQDEPEIEKTWQPQPRPNVLVEAGMALAISEKRTVLVEFGPLRGISDILGRHTVRMDNTPESRKRLLERLRTAGCSINDRGERWLRAGDFAVEQNSGQA